MMRLQVACLGPIIAESRAEARAVWRVFAEAGHAATQGHSFGGREDAAQRFVQLAREARLLALVGGCRKAESDERSGAARDVVEHSPSVGRARSTSSAIPCGELLVVRAARAQQRFHRAESARELSYKLGPGGQAW